MPENESSRMGKYVAGFVAGSVAGAVLGVLMAPASGKETRKRITAKSRELARKAKLAVETSRRFINGKKAKLAAAVQAGKAAVRTEVARLRKVA